MWLLGAQGVHAAVGSAPDEKSRCVFQRTDETRAGHYGVFRALLLDVDGTDADSGVDGDGDNTRRLWDDSQPRDWRIVRDTGCGLWGVPPGSDWGLVQIQSQSEGRSARPCYERSVSLSSAPQLYGGDVGLDLCLSRPANHRLCEYYCEREHEISNGTPLVGIVGGGMGRDRIRRFGGGGDGGVGGEAEGKVWGVAGV